jgi:autotransporter-associated beta strand protein
MILHAGTVIVGSNTALGIGDLQLEGGTIQSGAASGSTIMLANNFTVPAEFTTTVSGSQNLTFTGTGHLLAGATLTVDNSHGATTSDGLVDFSGILFGPGSLAKFGSGVLTLGGTNNYGGGTQLHGGALDVENDSALGTGAVTLSGGTLESEFSFTLANSFNVTADSDVFSLEFSGTAKTLTLTGGVTLSAGATLAVEPDQVDTGDTIIFSGSIGGSGALTVDGNGQVTFSGSAANTYTGITTVKLGLLFLNKPANVTAIAGPLLIDPVDPSLGTEVKLGADNQLDPTVTVTINGTGILKEGKYNLEAGSMTGFHTELIGPINSVITGDPPTLTVGFNNLSTTFDGVISGPGTVVKVGTGTWTLTGVNTYTGGTIIDGGTLRVEGTGSIGAVTVNPGGTLAGSGTTGPVTLSPGVNVSPGGSTPGILHAQSIAFPAGSSFVVRLNGPDPGTGYDQLQVTGTVDLGGATLSASLSPTYLPALGTSFTIITGTDTVSGTFAGHPDGDTFALGGTVFQIHYVNDGGNHAVVLTAIAYVTGTSLTAAPGPSVYGQAVTFTASVQTASAGAGTPTGTVTFLEGNSVLASAVPLDGNGQAALTLATLPAGPHTITAQYNPGAGFAASSASAGQTVNPAPLTVTANDLTKIAGEPNPTFTVSYSGFVLGEGPGVLGGAPTFSTPATTGSPPGTYAITPGGLTSGNYAITFVSGTLTVLSFAQATTNLVNQVTAANLDHGVENSLVSILDAAIDSFNRGDNTAGVNQLGAFKNHVRAQRGQEIEAGLADALLAYAQRIITVAPA